MMDRKRPVPDEGVRERCLAYLDGLAAIDDHSIQHLTAFRTSPVRMADEIRRGTKLGNNYLEEYAADEWVKQREATNVLRSFTVAFEDEVRGYHRATGALARLGRILRGTLDMATLEIETEYGFPARAPESLATPTLRDAYAQRRKLAGEQLSALEEGIAIDRREREIRLLRFGKPLPVTAFADEMAALAARKTELVKGFYGLA